MGSDLFATLRAGDVLLHHPFQGFGPVTDFIKQAASDPQVLAIKQTLYRVGSDSAIVGALVEAAAGRQGRDGHHRAARALRRRGEHRTRDQAAGGRRARHVRRIRLQDPREAGHGGAARGKRPAPLLPSGHRQLSRQDRAALHRLRPADRRRSHRRGHPRDFPAADRTDAGAEAAQAAARAVQPASGAARQDRPRDATTRAPASRRASSPSSTRSPNRPSFRRCTAPRAPASTSTSSCAACAACGRAFAAFRSASRCVPSSAAFSSIRASTISRMRARAKFTAAAPTGWTAICSAASRLPFRSRRPELQARVAEDLKLYLEDDMQAWVLDADGRYTRAERRRTMFRRRRA